MTNIFTAFLTITLLALSANARAETGGMVVLELFTSPFCTDTPPADEAFKSIVDDNNPKIITLSCHATYFNTDDKIDPLSTELCTERHKNYYIGLNLRGIFTPQAIINGQFDTEGTVESTVRAGIRMGQSMRTVTPVPLKLHEHALEISLPEMQLEKPVNIWLFGYDKFNQVEIPTDLELYSTFDYTNTVRHLEKLSIWDGSHRDISYPLKDMPADGYAVIVQYADHTNIIAAGKAERN